MSILLITDTQLGMALKNVNSVQWSPKILKWLENLLKVHDDVDQIFADDRNNQLTITKNENSFMIYFT